MFIQLMHVGRMSHPDNTLDGRVPVAPSAISADQEIFTPTGPKKTPTRRELSTEDIQATIADFRHAAASAIAAGADGVETHGANGYLLHQFLSPNTNHRTDSYGGSVENRSRFVIELAHALADEIGADRVDIRLSPAMPLANPEVVERLRAAPRTMKWIPHPLWGGAVYSATKAALWSATNSLRLELAPEGVHVVGVHVGWVDTAMAAQATDPKMDPADLVRSVLDAVEAGEYEVLADETSVQLKAGLSAPIEALYPELQGTRSRNES